nr:P1a [Tobacco vein distorting virus-associated RNA]UZQ18743.1 P1a [Tobacco vein distorting virus-associated RNA]
METARGLLDALGDPCTNVVRAFKARPVIYSFDQVVHAFSAENPFSGCSERVVLAVPHVIMGNSPLERLLELLATSRIAVAQFKRSIVNWVHCNSIYLGLSAATSAAALVIVERWRLSQAPPMQEEPVRLEDCLEIDDPDLPLLEQTVPDEPTIDRARAQLAIRKRVTRRVRPNSTARFIRVLRAEVKATVGTPTYTAANVAVIRHIVEKFAKEYNIRTSSYSHLMGDVISAVMTPYKSEYRQAAYCGSLTSRLRRWLVELK